MPVTGDIVILSSPCLKAPTVVVTMVGAYDSPSGPILIVEDDRRIPISVPRAWAMAVDPEDVDLGRLSPTGGLA